jgi:hypothetical protein
MSRRMKVKVKTFVVSVRFLERMELNIVMTVEFAFRSSIIIVLGRVNASAVEIFTFFTVF